MSFEDLRPAAEAAQARARSDLAAVPAGIARSEAVEYVVISALAGEVIANALGRLAQEHESALRFDPGRSGPGRRQADQDVDVSVGSPPATSATHRSNRSAARAPSSWSASS